MKTLIRKWLEIENPKPESFVTLQELRSMVKGAIHEAFSPDPTISPTWWDWGDDLRGTLERTISKHARKIAEQTTTEQIAEFVNQEKFLDAIIARIKSKQL